ncbi:patatin-like phospholipase domain-containing protein [Paenibacillus hexagrammi]|uniref:PNPLA domain-containing protein n=1 Tax=Paenibacillus hexagrammi TaxID=2908839 RepID=A0ABY3SLJ5_9BACL|nr:hypothetical protein [Paenibacillus sp. YPD9-1]UJF33946.1 hypothetical protein L0M14_01460 [Paenibacillus sp. YPD9-1]
MLYAAGISQIIPKQFIRFLLRLGVGRTFLRRLPLELLLMSKLELVMGNLFFQTAEFKQLLAAASQSDTAKPELVLNTSILENGKPLFLSTDPASPLWLENKRNHGIDFQDAAALPLSKMVAASACVPGIFNPIEIPFKDTAVHGVDGGVLDNLGYHAIQLLQQDGMPILISDASMPIGAEHYGSVNFVQSFFRIQDMFMDTIRDLRLGHEHNPFLVDMRTDLPGIDPAVRQLAMDMRTDLNSFTEVEAYSLHVCRLLRMRTANRPITAAASLFRRGSCGTASRELAFYANKPVYANAYSGISDKHGTKVSQAGSICRYVRLPHS